VYKPSFFSFIFVPFDCVETSLFIVANQIQYVCLWAPPVSVVAVWLGQWWYSFYCCDYYSDRNMVTIVLAIGWGSHRSRCSFYLLLIMTMIMIILTSCHKGKIRGTSSNASWSINYHPTVLGNNGSCSSLLWKFLLLTVCEWVAKHQLRYIAGLINAQMLLSSVELSTLDHSQCLSSTST